MGNETAPPVRLSAWAARIQRNGNNQARKSMTNMMLFVRHADGLGNELSFNELTRRVEWKGRAMDDADLVDVRLLIENAAAEIKEAFQPDRRDVWDATERVARENAYDPILNYLKSLKWDRRPRLDDWLGVYLGADSLPITRIFGAKFMVGAVARIYRPGCQMDNMLVLEGAQGAGKTSACRVLFGEDNLNSNLPDFKGKDACMALEGRWCIEVAELAALHRSDVSNAKKFISETVDRYRPTYGRKIVDCPRRCVFIGTTNERHYLKDPTGNRRYWPVACGSIHLEALRQDRDQLWAEATARFKAGEEWWLSDPDHISQAKALQSARVEIDPWGELIDNWLGDRPRRTYVRTSELLVEAICMPKDRITRPAEMRVANYLASVLGWVRDRRRFEPGQPPFWAFVPPE